MSAYPSPSAEALQEELQHYQDNEEVGHTLLFENDKVKVWHISLQPGERIHYHRHSHDYFWTVLQDGEGVSNQADGSQVPLRFQKNQTSFYNILQKGPAIHDLQNTGDQVLEFVTTELKY
ncbi:cupin domain-containing protein [Larkinella rosea]|uniref:Cupin domain-containing protein n=1 Tax=Larkinella rosea TaxID=2025312 RepID=A0A3P1BFF5_9BACT|nr:cupin domain-containing protein [Larkinella rosea]RRA99807.1 cupin domain-containing protein [Larkinella rosea]